MKAQLSVTGALSTEGTEEFVLSLRSPREKHLPFDTKQEGPGPQEEGILGY